MIFQLEPGTNFMILAIIILLLLSAFFSSAETANAYCDFVFERSGIGKHIRKSSTERKSAGLTGQHKELYQAIPAY